jgi:hypothetical protein
MWFDELKRYFVDGAFITCFIILPIVLLGILIITTQAVFYAAAIFTIFVFVSFAVGVCYHILKGDD